MSKKNQVFIGFLLMFLLIPRSVSSTDNNNKACDIQPQE